MDKAVAPLGRREKRKLEIRSRIEDAAYRLFQQQGIENTSIEQICVEADVARRTFYGHFANKHALLGGLGISRLYNQIGAHAAPADGQPPQHPGSPGGHDRLHRLQLRELRGNRSPADPDRTLDFCRKCRTTAGDRQLGQASFTHLIAAGVKLGDVRTEFSAEILAAMVVGTLNMLTTSWAMNSDYPIFTNLEEARGMFEELICKDQA